MYRANDLQSDARLVKGLIAVSVIVFVAQLVSGSGRATQGDVFYRGVLFGPLVADGEVWRIVTSGFLHLDPIHIAFNMYALYIFGPPVEKALGAVNTLLIYVGGLLGGAAAVLMFNFGTPTAGASGAVLGLAGSLAVLFKLNGVSLRQSRLGGLFLLNLALPLFTNISFWGHAGGIAGGALLTLIIVRRSGSRQLAATRESQLVAGAALVALVVVCVAVSRNAGLVTLL